ncbi:MAG: hypothetical protein MR283_06955 [Erysipelotrichaceae bacterium]|nr:hypothetical protein [Erysipelotrichaceae bacterium]
MQKNNKKNIGFIVLITAIVALFLLVGPLNFFKHGYYDSEVSFDEISQDELLDEYDVSTQEFSTTFIPASKNLTGVAVYFKNQSSTEGTVNLNISDASGNVVDSEDVELSKINGNTWYKVYTTGKYKPSQTYTLSISTSNANDAVILQEVPAECFVSEVQTDTALISFAYKKSTFNAESRILISILLLSTLVVVVSTQLGGSSKSRAKTVGFIGILVSILAWNYTFNSMDTNNTSFDIFQTDSESLSKSIVDADAYPNYYTSDDINKYGLARYSNINGEYYGFKNAYLSDDDWDNGYSKNESAIALSVSPYTATVAVAGNQLKFGNGDIFEIKKVTRDDTNYILEFYGPVLSVEKQGSLDNAVFLDSNGAELPRGYLAQYDRQYGLQGKIFRILYRILHNGKVSTHLYRLGCSLMAAFVFVIISYLIKKKYNTLMAGCFLFTFWLSPWVVNFAHNMYWVEFTWFIPMTIGLFCSLNIHSRTSRVVTYILTFISILIKCLCGYEYISTIMMGLIAFLIVDLVVAINKNDKKEIILLIRTIIILGILAIAGFLVAICIHAQVRGGGNILEGIKIIIKNDVMRRTSGANLNDFSYNLWSSINASVWEVVCKYFRFSTEIVTGIPGNLFPLLAMIPAALFLTDSLKKQVNIEEATLYFVMLVTTLSWIVLAKSHSYIHTHISFVLWYFGFIQICFYIVIKRVLAYFKK